MSYVQIPLKNLLHVSKIATIYYLSFSPDYRSKTDLHDFWELIYVDRGITLIRAGELEYPLKAGQVILHAPNLPHKICCDGSHGANVFIISFSCRSPAMKRFGLTPLTVPPASRPLIASLIDEGASTFDCSSHPLVPTDNAPLGGEQMIRLLLETLLIKLLRVSDSPDAAAPPPPPSSPPTNDLPQAIMTYIDSRVGEKITIGELCEVFHYGKSRLCDLFRIHTGKTIITYHTEKKIEAAKEYLCRGKTVRETSALLGFDTPQYFSRVFKTYTGMSPHSYRTSLLFSLDTKVKRRQLNSGAKKRQDIV